MSSAWHANVLINQEIQLNSGIQSFHYAGMTDRIIGDVIEPHLQTLSPPQMSGWYHLVQTSHNMVGFSIKDSPQPETT